jgi:hypothetical protein
MFNNTEDKLFLQLTVGKIMLIERIKIFWRNLFMNKLNEVDAYIIGLICARGHILTNDKRIIIEFAHKNKTIAGIAYCPKCGDLATQKKDNNLEGYLICKGCGNKVSKSVKKIYEQQESTIASLNKIIIPFIKSVYKIDFEVVGNDHMTFLVLDFSRDENSFNRISGMFNGKYGFDSFTIPEEMYNTSKENKIEFMNGFMDAAGFFNSGSWLVRQGKNGKYRMRAYLQIVRNWKMSTLICNFLKKELNLPIQTIDWGHPNIRDSSMEDYYNSNPLSWSREHQVKFYPEYYNLFNLRIEHKEKMFNELVDFNNKVSFNSSEDCNPPSPISLKSVKPFHPGENDPRIPSVIRKHYNAYWQVCNDIGCVFSKRCINESKTPELLFLTGKEGNEKTDVIRKEYEKQSKKLTEEIEKQHKNIVKKKSLKIAKKTDPEEKLYEPISKWLQNYLEKEYSQEVKTHDTSSFYLDKFIAQNNLFEEFEFCNEYEIKPDIVGFLLKDKEICFVEVKIEALTIKDIGQLLGYCIVGKPKEAILISPEKPSANLIKTLKSNNSILSFDGSKIKIGTWKGNDCEIMEI